MRRLKRSVFRATAEQKQGKTSRILHRMWRVHQEKKYGFNTAEAFRRIGTARSEKQRAAMRRIMSELLKKEIKEYEHNQ